MNRIKKIKIFRDLRTDEVNKIGADLAEVSGQSKSELGEREYVIAYIYIERERDRKRRERESRTCCCLATCSRSLVACFLIASIQPRLALAHTDTEREQMKIEVEGDGFCCW